MSKTIHIVQYFTVLVFLSGCAERKNSLPRAMTPEEIRAFFPKSEPMEVNAFEQSMRDQGLLDVQSIDESILVKLRYSSKDNFFGADVYGTLELAYLQPDVAQALVSASKQLQRDNPNLRLLIYDAARPLSVQHILWNKLDSLPVEERKKYVSDPEEISIHNYGCAVDLTIYDLDLRKPLDMGTGYDFFGELAYPRMERQLLNEGKLSLKQLNNRILLRSVMEESGFMPITTEWWHFNFHSRRTAASKYKIIP